MEKGRAPKVRLSWRTCQAKVKVFSNVNTGLKTWWLTERGLFASRRFLNLPFISLLSVQMDVINCLKTKAGSSLKPSDATFFILSMDFECQGRAGSKYLCTPNCLRLHIHMSRETMWDHSKLGHCAKGLLWNDITSIPKGLHPQCLQSSLLVFWRPESCNWNEL